MGGAFRGIKAKNKPCQEASNVVSDAETVWSFAVNRDASFRSTVDAGSHDNIEY
jgi:hypothetical protein